MPSQGFHCDIRKALIEAGLRFKPMPRRRKQWLRIQRRRKIDHDARMAASLEEMRGVKCTSRAYRDEATGMMMTVTRFEKQDGSVQEHYGLPMFYA